MYMVLPGREHPAIYRLFTGTVLAALQCLFQLEHVHGGDFGNLKEDPGRNHLDLELSHSPDTHPPGPSSLLQHPRVHAGGATLQGGGRHETKPCDAHLCEYLVRTAFSLSWGWYVSRKFSLFTRGCRSWERYPL